MQKGSGLSVGLLWVVSVCRLVAPTLLFMKQLSGQKHGTWTLGVGRRLASIAAVAFFISGIYWFENQVQTSDRPYQHHSLWTPSIASENSNRSATDFSPHSNDLGVNAPNGGSSIHEKLDCKQSRHTRPTLVWHVGLPKTGTTFLQCTLCAARSSSANNSVLSDETLLRDDQIHYLGTCPFRDCGLSAMPDRPPGLALMRHRASAFISAIARVRDYKVGEGAHQIRTKNLTEHKIRSYFASGSTSWGPDPISDGCSYPNCDNRTSYPLLSVAPALLDRLERVRLEYVRTIQSKSPTDDDNGAAPASAVIVFEGSHRFDDALVAAFARYLVGDDDVSGSDNVSSDSSVSGCGRWNVEIVVYYRRLFEWLPSKYNSKMKLSLKSEWPENANASNVKRGRQDSPGWVAPPFDLNDRGAFSTYVSLLESFSAEASSLRRKNVQHPVETVRRKFSRYFGKDSVLVVNPHTNAQERGVVDPSLYHFLCSIVKANNTCRRLTEQEVAADGVTSVSTPLRTAPVPANPSVVMHYDQIAVAAFLHGGLIDHKRFPEQKPGSEYRIATRICLAKTQTTGPT
jgi:hypothetical protein